MFHQRRGCLHHVDVGLLEHYFFAGALSSGLLAGLLRPADHDTLSERVEAVHQNAAEAAAIRDQKRDRRNAPHDAQHGEQAARHVALQRDSRLRE